jgi:murein L,D-transpeptidase YafK
MRDIIKRYQFLATLTGLLICCSAIPALASFLTSPLSKAVCQKVAPSLESELDQLNLDVGDPIFIRVFKESSELELWVKGEEKYTLFKTYDICSYSGNLGPKEREGDRQSPEGFYFVGRNQLNPYSSFHLSFNIGYPNKYDRAYGRTGSALMVHGNCVSIGCFAMTDSKVEEIYTMAEAALRNGQPFFRVHIFPFRMTAENMRKHKRSKWIRFWENLREGYEYFEHNNVPPDTIVKSKRYIFTSDHYDKSAAAKKKHLQISNR